MISRPMQFSRCSIHNPTKLRGLLDESLQPTEATVLTEHLSQCEWCQETLESLASDPDAWEESRESLTELIVTQRCTEAIVSDRTGGQVALSSQEHKMLLGWLAPTERPDSLGRMGNYEILAVVGYGGMGVVLEAWDIALHRIVAIKAMHPHLAAIGVAKQRFIREARAAAAVVHPHVVPIHSVDAEHQPPYLVMQLIAGETLQSRIDRQGALGVETTLRIGHQIAQGLAAAHAQGLVHRDVKPANILLESGTERALLTDFGVARALDDASVTASGTIAGTPEYMSPEQSHGESLDERSDLFSFGSVLYAMLTARPPFRAESSLAVLRRVSDSTAKPICDIEPQTPRWMQAICNQLHAKSPDHRPRSAEHVAEMLQHCLAHVREPHRIPLPRSLPAWYPRSHRTVLGAYVLLVLVLMIGAGGLGWGIGGLFFANSTIDRSVVDTQSNQQGALSEGPKPAEAEVPIESADTQAFAPGSPYSFRESLESHQYDWDPWDGLMEPVQGSIDALRSQELKLR